MSAFQKTLVPLCGLWLFFSYTRATAQLMPAADTTRRGVTIHLNQDDNRVRFSATTPPLQQILGAPTAFYTFFWEFGDGHYSEEAAPEHVYTKPGDHQAQVWTTQHYDNGKVPPARPQTVPIKKISYSPPAITAPAIPDGFHLKSNRDPVPGEDMVVVVSYENDRTYPTSGKLYLFYNETKYHADNFVLTGVRTHHGEKVLSNNEPVAQSWSPELSVLWASSQSAPDSLPRARGLNLFLNKAIEEARQQYKQAHVIEFNDMPALEKRHIFYSFKTTPEMLKDTSALITIRGIYVPERGEGRHKQKNLEMEIVTSHDPNKLSVKDTRLNFRRYRGQDLHFKVRFQNNGEGPARSIRVTVDVPDAYDKKSLVVRDRYPACPICPETPVSYSCLDTTFTDKQIIFHFKNIYVAGSRQKNVHDYDSTKGFIKYSLRFRDKIEKEKSVSRAAIVFDKNEPVETNRAATRFKAGKSYGMKAGYGYYPDFSNRHQYLVGVTLSPYKSQHGYWQSELMVGSLNWKDSVYREDIIGTNGDFVNLFEVSQQDQHKQITLYVVPLSYRYSCTSWLGIGAGAQVALDIANKTTRDALHENYYYYAKQNIREPRAVNNYTSSDTETTHFKNLRAGVFGDLVMGSARIGPAVGIRYMYQWTEPRQQWQFYMIWKL